jgi:hypothetical protein
VKTAEVDEQKNEKKTWKSYQAAFLRDYANKINKDPIFLFPLHCWTQFHPDITQSSR